MKYLDTTNSTNFYKNESELINDILFARKWISYRENEVPLKTLKNIITLIKLTIQSLWKTI
ncbi:hypothetical protein [Metamycoplasma equirhinis]|uniref:hypothetical protein n=1 Tax=Metamycoplasma equirhinis TaxID=92402 RepID=UPI003593DF05